MEGIWYAHFSTGTVQGDGMAVLRDGEILGGDPAHTYTGSYQEDGASLYANVRVSPFSGAKVPADIEHPVTYFLQGLITGDRAVVKGHPHNRPDAVLSVELQRGA